MRQKTTDETALYAIGWSLIGLSVFVLVILKAMPQTVEKYMLPCLLHMLTGFYCPGCGGTRSFVALVQGKWITSFIYHPVVLYAAVIGGWFMVSQTVERISKRRWKIGLRYRDGYLWGALGIIVANFFIKNIALFLGYDLMKIFF